MSRTLIWAPPSAHKTVWKNPPDVLLCSLQPRQIDKWRKKNRWADAIEMIIFTDDDPPKEVRSAFACYAFHTQTGMAPHLVVNAPPKALPALRDMNGQYEDTDVDSMRAYLDAVGYVAASLLHLRCAWIQPESDHSAGALVVAQRRGMVVAYSQSAGIDSIGAMGAGQRNVNVTTLGTIQAKRMIDG